MEEIQSIKFEESLPIGESHVSIDSKSPLWQALKDNPEAQTQLREILQKMIDNK